MSIPLEGQISRVRRQILTCAQHDNIILGGNLIHYDLRATLGEVHTREGDLGVFTRVPKSVNIKGMRRFRLAQCGICNSLARLKAGPGH